MINTSISLAHEAVKILAHTVITWRLDWGWSHSPVSLACWCWLLAGGLSSSHLGLSTELLSVLTTWQLTPPRVSHQREQGNNGFCDLALEITLWNESGSPASIQGEGVSFFFLKRKVSRNLQSPDHPWLQGNLGKQRRPELSGLAYTHMIHRLGHNATPDKIRAQLIRKEKEGWWEDWECQPQSWW